MADLSDAENAIVALIAGIVYPNGTGQSSAILNDANAPLPVKIFRGWPVPATLDSDLAAGIANISIFPRGTGKNTTRYPIDFHDLTPFPAATFTATVNNNVAVNQITIGGTASASVTQYVTINIGGKIAVSYSVLAADTPTTIATALATLITAAFAPATSSGPNITVTSSAYLSALVGVQINQLAEIRRQSESIQITLWCPTPLTRDNVAKSIEPTLANTTFLTLVDNFAARFRYTGTWVSDNKETLQLYRRDIFYDVEYPTTLADVADQVTSIQVNDNASAGGAPAVTTVYPLPPQPTNPLSNPPFKAELSNS